MVKVSKTINSLHFEDLEPHRFEDLVRQLIYDLKDWKMIEAIGRSGSDEGFDIRAWENNYYVEEDNILEDEDSREQMSRGEDKIWLIQCKREKVITPKKIKKYANEIIKKNKGNLYGIILVAPCDFSKKTRDVFVETIRGSGVQEFYLWGRAELEDMLFQPKNDHLLFAYFGISLAIRRKSLRSQIRYKLSVKRKVIKCLGDVRGNHFKPVLIRDANDTNYPYKHKIKDFDKKPKWKQYFFVGHYHDGIEILLKKFYAYLADDKIHWDYVENIDTAQPPHNPWEEQTKKTRDDYRVWRFWNNIPEKNRAWLEIVRRIPYDKIIEIDPSGDIYVQDPHIYVPFDEMNGPFQDGYYGTLRTTGYFYQPIYNPEIKNRIRFFPKKFPEPKEDNKIVVGKKEKKQ